MPEVEDKITGKTVAKMPYDTAGQMAAEKMVAENPGYEINDGAARSKTMYAGGGETGYNAIGRPMYKKGGSPEDYSKEENFPHGNWMEPEFAKAQMEIDAEEKKAKMTPKKDSKPKSQKGSKAQGASGNVYKKGAKGSEGKKGSKKKK